MHPSKKRELSNNVPCQMQEKRSKTMSTNEIMEICKTYKEYKDYKKDIDNVLKELEGKLLLALKEANADKLQAGAYKVSLTVCHKTSVDSKALSVDLPEVYSKYTKVSQYNRFTVR